MSKFVVTKQKGQSMTFDYGLDGFLRMWKVEGEWSIEFWREAFKRPPLIREVLIEWKQHLNVNLQEVPEDLSFEAFWEAFRYKVGNKKQAEKLWNLMIDGDKIAALSSVPRYLHWLACRPHMDQTHATTWLNQRRWENEYK